MSPSEWGETLPSCVRGGHPRLIASGVDLCEDLA